MIKVIRRSRDCDGSYEREYEMTEDEFYLDENSHFSSICHSAGLAAMTGSRIDSNDWDGYGDGWKNGSISWTTEEGFVSYEWSEV